MAKTTSVTRLAVALLAVQLVPAAPAQAFETASIHPSHLTPGCFSMAAPGGTQYALTCATLRYLISVAYSINPEGKQKALDTYYDLRATTLDGQPWTTESIRPMLRQLLAERFHLLTHAAKREVSGYSLLEAKGGSKLQATSAEEVPKGQKAGAPFANSFYPGHVSGRGADMAMVAGLLTIATGVPVVDRTGLPGVFNINLRYAPDTDPNPTLPSLFTAVEEQLGLRLKAEKVTVDTLVVDAIDEVPTAN